MVTVLTSSTTTLGAVELPTQGAFQLCFLIGAVAAFVGAGLAGLIRAGNLHQEPAATAVSVGAEPR